MRAQPLESPMRLPISMLLCLAGCANDPQATVTDSSSTSTPTTTATTTSTVTDPCDGLDNDGDGEFDEDAALLTWYLDNDGDGFGEPDTAVEACEVPLGYVDNDGDCNDDNDQAWTNRTDTCDGVDNDCDDNIDEDHRADWVLSTMGEDGHIYAIDRATGAVTQGVTIDLPERTNINSADSLDVNFVMLNVAGTPNQLMSVDVCTGVTTSVGPTATDMPGIAFGPGQVLYGVDVDNDNFVQIDQTNASATTVFPFGFDITTTGIAYDCTDELLYVADRQGAQIFAVDMATGVMQNFQPTAVPFANVGLEFDNATRTLLASTGTELWSIDPATGTGTFLSTFQTTESFNDLVFLAPCP